MRAQQRCPKCNGTKLYVCENRQPDANTSRSTLPLRITTSLVPRESIGAPQGDEFLTMVGSYQTWICAACGYTEWYALDRQQVLEKLARVSGSGVRIVEGQAAPYR